MGLALALGAAACAQESDEPLPDLAAPETTTTTDDADTGTDELELLWSTEDIRFVTQPVEIADAEVGRSGRR